jgi:hypothetical protein
MNQTSPGHVTWFVPAPGAYIVYVIRLNGRIEAT